MLRKLLKYDLRANMKIYCFLWPCIVVAMILQGFLIPADIPESLQSVLVPLVLILLIFSIFGAVITSMVVCINRFYKGLLSEEGYLMFTLPVHPWQLVLSKLLVSMMTLLVTALLSLGSVVVLMGSILSELDLDELTYALEAIWGQISPEQPVLLIVNLLLSQALSILVIYLACAIGHLAKKRRVLFSVLAYFGVNYGLQFLTGILAQMGFYGSPWITTLSNAASVALCFYFTQLILKKRLNLE